MNGADKYTAKFQNWIDLFEVLGASYGSTSSLYVTVTTKDVAENENTRVYNK